MLKLAVSMIILAALAPTSYATFADQLCNNVADATPTPDNSICQMNGMGACTLEPRTGDYYCGWAGASCPDASGTMYAFSQAPCDMGTCLDGQCRGTFGDACTINGDDTGCLGWLYCSPGGTCGGKGAQCGDVDGCDTGLECVFASPSSMTGICTNMAQAALPNASQGARKRHLLAKSRFDTWA